MSDSKQLLPAYGEQCPHCSADLEAASANGMLTTCGRCHCMFLAVDVVSYRRCNPKGPTHGADQEPEAASG
jgi:hypothetical protein